MVAMQEDGVETLRVLSSMTVLTFVAVALRVFARSRTKSGLALEDFLMIVALGMFYIVVGLFFAGLLRPNASGTSNRNLMTLPEVNNYAELLYIGGFFYVTIISIIKISILFFYSHIFRTHHFRRLIYGVGAVCLLWWLISLFFLTFQCNPGYTFGDYGLRLDPRSGATCFATELLMFGLEITNMFCDLLILALPIYMVRSLQMKSMRKLCVTTAFLLGGFVCIASCVRIYYLYNQATGELRNLPAAMNWGIVQLAVAIVCACVPTYGPLLQLHSKTPSSVKAWHSSVVSSLCGSRASSSIATTNADSSKAVPGAQYSDQAAYRHIEDRAYLTRMDTVERLGQGRVDVYSMGRARVHDTLGVI